MRRRLIKDDAERRDLVRVGLRVDESCIDRELELADFSRCPHCYYTQCKCTGERRRHARYSIADYTRGYLTEDDLIERIDSIRYLEGL